MWMAFTVNAALHRAWQIFSQKCDFAFFCCCNSYFGAATNLKIRYLQPSLFCSSFTSSMRVDYSCSHIHFQITMSRWKKGGNNLMFESVLNTTDKELWHHLLWWLNAFYVHLKAFISIISRKEKTCNKILVSREKNNAFQLVLKKTGAKLWSLIRWTSCLCAAPQENFIDNFNVVFFMSWCSKILLMMLKLCFPL